MKSFTRKPIKWRIGTHTETLLVIQKIEEKERPFCYFPDGHKHSIRVQVNRDTGEIINGSDGSPRICSPWLLKDIF